MLNYFGTVLIHPQIAKCINDKKLVDARIHEFSKKVCQHLVINILNSYTNTPNTSALNY